MRKIASIGTAALGFVGVAFNIALQYSPEFVPQFARSWVVGIAGGVIVGGLVLYLLWLPLHRKSAEDPRYDVWLHDAIWYVVYGTWDKEKTTGDIDHEKNFVAIVKACVDWFPQMAMEGRIPIWGKKAPNVGLFELISADYWSRHQVEITSWTGEPWECRTDERVNSARDGLRYALKTNKAIVEDIWQRYGKHQASI